MSLCSSCLKLRDWPDCHRFNAKFHQYATWFKRRFGVSFYPEVVETIAKVPDNAVIVERHEISKNNLPTSYSASERGRVLLNRIFKISAQKVGLVESLIQNKGRPFLKKISTAPFFFFFYFPLKLLTKFSQSWFFLKISILKITQRNSEYKSIPFKNLILPPRELRWGGESFKYDFLYVKSAKQVLRTLAYHCDLSHKSRMLDIGCGSGRLWTGILSVYGRISEYVGIDFRYPCVKWAKENLTDTSAYASFHFINVFNERYNLKGEPLTPNWNLPVPHNHFNVISAISLFSHMRFNDIKIYLQQIRLALQKNGLAFLTLYVEDGGEVEQINPSGYDKQWSGPLQCVRVNRQIFEDTLRSTGLRIKHHAHTPISQGESLYVVARA